MKHLYSFLIFLFFSYPREKDQGVAFEKKIAPADLVMFFDCQDVRYILRKPIEYVKSNNLCISFKKQGTLVARVMARAAASTEKRADDNEETIKTRIATFRANTNDILSQYTDKTLVVSI